MAGAGANVTWDVRWCRELGSTNAVAMDLARAGADEGMVVVADHQTAGRGRLGRAWLAPPGSSLLMSVLFRPGEALPISQSHLLLGSVALAATAACQEVAGVSSGIKWPNDLVVETDHGNRKLAGLLAESDVSGSTVRAMVVGVGLNVNWPARVPEPLAGIAVALNHVCGRDIDRPTLLFALLAALQTSYRRVLDPDGRRSLAADYRRRCVTLGQQVRVEAGGEAFTGVAERLSDEGHLGVRSAGGLRWFAAGDVTHLRLA